MTSTELVVQDLEEFRNGHCPADFRNICNYDLISETIATLKEQEWHTTKEKLPKDGSVLDIVIGEDEKGRIAITAALVKDGKIMFHVGDAPNAKDGYGDVTDYVLKWHKVPNIIRKEDGLYWED